MMIDGEVRSIALVTSIAFSLANFRGPLIRRMIDAGIKVYALAPDFDDDTRRAVRALGAEPVDIPLERTGLHPGRDLLAVIGLTQLLRRIRPDATLCYFIKPVIYGTLAAWIARVPRRYALIAGLGYVFTFDDETASWRRRFLRAVALGLYRIVFKLCRTIFFQNADDRDALCGASSSLRAKAVLVSGTGVDLASFPPAPAVTSPITFTLVARLLREKGIYEFVEASRRIKATHPDVRFLLVGGTDSNPGGLSEANVRAWEEEGILEWRGHVADVRAEIARSSVFVLPSYREGKPRSTQEAMAMARPVITTDAPGCRDTVEEGVNGFMVPIRDAVSLEHAMRRFLAEPTLIEAMGLESRRIAEERFDVDRINGVMMQAMALEPTPRGTNVGA